MGWGSFIDCGRQEVNLVGKQVTWGRRSRGVLRIYGRRVRAGGFVNLFPSHYGYFFEVEAIHKPCQHLSRSGV